MDINEMRNDLSLRGKNGIPFILAATIVWAIILVVFLLPYDMVSKNLLTFYCSGVLLPFAIFISKLLKADWKMNDNPIGNLGFYLNLAQLMYFPILFWAFSNSPNQMIMFFGLITGAHLFPFGWFYHTKAYIVMAPIIATIITIIGSVVDHVNMWYIPLTMIICLSILNVWLSIDFRLKGKVDQKVKEEKDLAT